MKISIHFFINEGDDGKSYQARFLHKDFLLESSLSLASKELSLVMPFDLFIEASEIIKIKEFLSTKVSLLDEEGLSLQLEASDRIVKISSSLLMNKPLKLIIYEHSIPLNYLGFIPIDFEKIPLFINFLHSLISYYNKELQEEEIKALEDYYHHLEEF